MFFLLFIIYLIFGPAKNVEADLINEILYLVIIPIILILATIGICILVGLPIRLIPNLYNWWLANPFVSFMALTIGLILLTLTLNQNFIDTRTILVNEEQIIQETPNNYLLTIGWFVTAFALLHFYPKQFIVAIKNKFGNKVPKQNESFNE